MADKKLKKIEETNKKWNCGGMNSEDAIKEIEKILSEKDCDGGSECQCPVTEGRKRSCHNAGPMTINPFFNFMKELRENTCFNATATEIAQEGGAKWRAMSHCDKAPYIVQAYNIHCESYTMDDENIVSVILRNITGLVIDESYRFCLVLLQEKKIKRDLIVGCSNITKLQSIQEDYGTTNGTYSKLHHSTATTATNNKRNSNFTDISIFDKISDKSDEITNSINHEVIEREPTEINHKPMAFDGDQRMALFGHINQSVLPGLGICVLITSLFVIIWGAKKFRNERNHNRAGSTCYSAGIDQINDLHEKENRNRYLKLQATTSL